MHLHPNDATERITAGGCFFEAFTKRCGGLRMRIKADGKRVDRPLLAKTKLADDDLAELRRGTTRAFVQIVRRMQQGLLKKTVSS